MLGRHEKSVSHVATDLEFWSTLMLKCLGVRGQFGRIQHPTELDVTRDTFSSRCLAAGLAASMKPTAAAAAVI